MGYRTFRIPFGDYQGKLIEDVPQRYLEWCVSRGISWCPGANRELARRKNSIYLTPHAINRGSRRLMSQWLEDSIAEEGLHDWMQRRARNALEEVGVVGENGRVVFDGIVWIFATGVERATLKSCWLENRPQED